MEAQRQYFNDGQAYMLAIMPRDLVAVCGRGFGKGALQAARLQRAYQGMPGFSAGFVTPSIKRGLTNMLPSILQHFERWGFKRDLHYVVGHKPPRDLKWPRPIITPESWEKTISFYNGSVVHLISQERKGTSNSLSLDYLIIDEAKFIDFEQLKDETFQANRGNQMYFGSHPLHHGMTITTDMPNTKKGSWVLQYEQHQDPELIEVLGAMANTEARLTKLVEENPHDSKLQKRLAENTKEMDMLRSRALLFKKYTSVDNLAILGEEFIRRARRDLPALTFATSIMCRQAFQSADGFYNALTEEGNLYTAPNEGVLNAEALNSGPIEDDCRQDGDLEPDAPLIVAFDANANINWLVAGQVGRDGRLRILKSFFVKYERKLPELIDDFTTYYRHHTRRHVVFYYDSTFVGNNYALHNNDFHKEIETRLRRAGWVVRPVYIGRPMGHVDKNALINRMLKGRARLSVMINRDNNPDLLISIQSAGVYNGKKDKRGEKLVETAEDKLESRTDGSDAFDTLLIGAEKFPTAQQPRITVNAFS